MRPLKVKLPDGRLWLRVADPSWADPLDLSFAAKVGGRWNGPGGRGALYLNADVLTARLQVERMLEGQPVEFDDLDDDAFVLAVATLPREQICADAVSDAGLESLGLPTTYPRDANGAEIPHATCRRIAVRLRAHQGVWCRSACSADGRGREVAWFPRGTKAHATPAGTPLSLGRWRDAESWRDLGLPDQPLPRSL